MSKGVLLFFILAAFIANYAALADDEKQVSSAASIPGLKSGRNRRKLPTSMIISIYNFTHHFYQDLVHARRLYISMCICMCLICIYLCYLYVNR